MNKPTKTIKRGGGRDCKPLHGSVCWRTVDACEVVVGDPPVCVGCRKGREYVIDDKRLLNHDDRALELAVKDFRKSISPEQHDPGRAIKNAARVRAAKAAQRYYGGN